MFNIMQSTPKTVFASVWLATLLAGSFRSRPTETKGRVDFDAFYDTVTRAETELFRGRPQSLEALWTRAPEVTLFGVSGGSGEHGWEQVKKRLDWTSTQYRDGSLTTERIASYVEGNLGYIVQIEKVRFKVPGSSAEKRLEIRATWIFRRERDSWRILHRQADPLINRKGPAEGKIGLRAGSPRRLIDQEPPRCAWETSRKRLSLRVSRVDGGSSGACG